jgi:hypothetical protein
LVALVQVEFRFKGSYLAGIQMVSSPGPGQCRLPNYPNAPAPTAQLCFCFRFLSFASNHHLGGSPVPPFSSLPLSR